MAQALSEEEFHRMQAHLLELRTQNYQLSDDLRKNTAELVAVRQKSVTLEKDYIKAQKVLQEVDALLSENEMLQGKLHSQEDDFRLQNSTLMQELSKLCTQIEELEHENKDLKDGKVFQAESSSPTSSSVDGELLRLQAENAALQKKMTDGLPACPAGPAVRSTGLVMKQDALRWSALCPNPITQCFGPEVELQLHTEVEEKRLLKEQLQALEVTTNLTTLGEKEDLYNDSRTKIDEIQQRKEEELKSMNIRIQKLQGDLLSANQSVGEMKEQLQSRQKEHELVLHALKDQVACQSAVSQEQVESILTENDALRTNLAALEQIQTVKTQEMNLLRDQNTALNVELQQKRTEQESFLAQRDDLSSQLQESNRANSRLLEQLTEVGQEKDRVQQELEEAKKTADKRKAMLDELAIDIITEKSRHKEELSDVRLQHEKEVLGVRARYEKELRGLHEDKNRTEEEIRSQLRDEKARNKELEGLQQSVEELQAQVQSMEGTKGWFERRLKEAEVQYQLQFHIDLFTRILQCIYCLLSCGHLMIFMMYSPCWCGIQEIKDTVDGQRILEKKGSSALKDLKRQLQLERKRADKLQERLQEILTNTKTRTGLEELVLSEISSPNRTQQRGDSSSVSSFSYGEIMKEGASAQSTNKSASGSPQSQRPADLSDDEVGELFLRLAEVQQEKWMLEEKVKHLEVSCSSMADDICKKSAIIETYVMDTHGAHGAVAVANHGGQVGGHGHGLGSVLRDLVKPGDENLREMNKKLQNMLEEQLTKNMHLQKVGCCTLQKVGCCTLQKVGGVGETVAVEGGGHASE
uniref:GRIP1 associated protein 1 n=1 Tax=Oncorhynchus mykiss TaxID=8022 RepID=A0A8C7P2F5_ONCMY